MCFSPQRRAIFRHQNFKKCTGTVSFFSILTCKCASRHSGAQFWRIRCLKSAPKARCFVAPQRCAIFRHRNFKKCSEPDVLCTFSLKICCLPQRRAIFDIGTSNSAQKLTCFVHFHLKICFSPQRRAMFDFCSDHMTPHPPL